ncbi:MAG: TetR/AcrR family transcriptional regulator [Betaproteobacteria bacterium]
MGIKERQERDREAVHRAILDAARDLFVREGYQNVSIRKIAERIEYSPAAIYSYFASKDDIFFALAEEGFRLLGTPDEDGERLRALPPLDRIRTIFWRVYEFSRDHPEYFALMFVDRSVPRIMREYERFAFVRETKAQVVRHLQECIDAGELPPTVRPMVAFRLLTMGLMGVATMRMSDRLAPGEDADALARDVIEVTLAGLRSGVALHAPAAGCEIAETESVSVAPGERSDAEERR